MRIRSKLLQPMIILGFVASKEMTATIEEISTAEYTSQTENSQK